jgi:hypothetical protein
MAQTGGGYTLVYTRPRDQAEEYERSETFAKALTMTNGKRVAKRFINERRPNLL